MPDIQWLIFIHLFAKFGFAANEAVTSLKMVEKGLKREDLAIVVLIDFPFQIIAGWLVASWARGDKPLRPWVIAFWPRLFFTLVAALIVLWFPKPPLTMGFFAFLVTYNVLAGFASYVSLTATLLVADRSLRDSTVQFVGISAFHTRVSDPVIGGTYMTVRGTQHVIPITLNLSLKLLNTFANMGGTWPKWFVLKGSSISRSFREHGQ